MFNRKSFNLPLLIIFSALTAGCASQSTQTYTFPSDLDLKSGNLNPEIIAWLKCGMASKIEPCESFLAEFPESKFSSMATKKMQSIRTNENSVQ